MSQGVASLWRQPLGFFVFPPTTPRQLRIMKEPSRPIQPTTMRITIWLGSVRPARSQRCVMVRKRSKLRRKHVNWRIGKKATGLTPSRERTRRSAISRTRSGTKNRPWMPQEPTEGAWQTCSDACQCTKIGNPITMGRTSESRTHPTPWRMRTRHSTLHTPAPTLLPCNLE